MNLLNSFFFQKKQNNEKKNNNKIIHFMARGQSEMKKTKKNFLNKDDKKILQNINRATSYPYQLAKKLYLLSGAENKKRNGRQKKISFFFFFRRKDDGVVALHSCKSGIDLDLLPRPYCYYNNECAMCDRKE
jgi:hypothetical protein